MGLTMLHLGLGAFHRAHQAVVLQRLIDEGDADGPSWSIAAGNLRQELSDTAVLLAQQNHAYTVQTVSPDGERHHQRVTSIQHTIPFDPSASALIQIGAQPTTRIISCTVTEAGYEVVPGHVDDVQTLYGALMAILRERMRRYGGAVTLLSCDNVRHNGDRLRAGLMQAIDLVGDMALRTWVEAHTTSPNSMVDRITPRPPADLPGRVHMATGWKDAAPVMAEAYLQWVIEEEFCNGRPPWERVGVQMVANVTPFEEAKIRMLNASHSLLAWAGALAGHTFIDEAARDARILAMAQSFLTEEVMPCLNLPEAPSPVDLPSYRDAVLSRFGNAALADTVQRVASDSYAKLPGFIAPTLRQRLDRGWSIAHSAILPALYLGFLMRWHRGELSFDYQDQVLSSGQGHAMCSAKDPVECLCTDRALWGAHAGNASLTRAVRRAYAQVRAMYER